MLGTRMQRRPAAYTPFPAPLAKEMDDMRTRMSRLFEDPFTAEPITPPLMLYPAVEITETPQAFLVTAELPGLTAEDVTVEFEDGMLTIRGEKTEKRDQQDKQFHVTERTYGAFRRAFAFPSTLNAEALEANFIDGVLTVKLPKAAEAKPKKIEVKATKG